MGLEALSVSFSNRLLSRKSQWSYRRIVSFSSEESSQKEELQTENTRILHKLQSSLINASLSGLSILAKLSLFHQVLICGTHVLFQICQFWNTFWAELGNDGPYQVSISAMRLRLSELQESNNETWKIRAEGLKNNYEEVDGILHHQGLPFVSEAIRTELISRHHNDPLEGHFSINKTKDLIGQKYYWPSLWKDIEAYVKGCDICLGSKTVRYKFYRDLQSLPIPTHQWKDFLIDFIMRLPISTNWCNVVVTGPIDHGLHVI